MKEYRKNINGFIGFLGSIITIFVFVFGVSYVGDINKLFSSRDEIGSEKNINSENSSDAELVNRDYVVRDAVYTEIEPEDFLLSYIKDADGFEKQYLGERVGFSHSFSPDDIILYVPNYLCRNYAGEPSFFSRLIHSYRNNQAACFVLDQENPRVSPINVVCTFEADSYLHAKKIRASLSSNIDSITAITGLVTYIQAGHNYLDETYIFSEADGFYVNFDEYSQESSVLVLSECQAVLAFE